MFSTAKRIIHAKNAAKFMGISFTFVLPNSSSRGKEYMNLKGRASAILAIGNGSTAIGMKATAKIANSSFVGF
jgi:hypothetical protein